MRPAPRFPYHYTVINANVPETLGYGDRRQSHCPVWRTLDDRAIEQVATFLSAFAVPMRLKILNALRYGERNVGDLASTLGSGQANVSKHLRLLAQAGLIDKTARGTSVFYRIADPRLTESA